MDGNGYRALAFLHGVLCGAAALGAGYYGGEVRATPVVAATVLMTTAILTGFHFHEWRRGKAGESGPVPAPSMGRVALLIGWASIAYSLLTHTVYPVYLGYVAMLGLMLHQAFSMGAKAVYRAGIGNAQVIARMGVFDARRARRASAYGGMRRCVASPRPVMQVQRARYYGTR